MELFRSTDGGVTLAGTECAQCHLKTFPPNRFGCERCGAHGDDLIAVEFGGEGSLLAIAAVQLGENEILLGTVALDDGPVVRALVASDDPAATGDRVRAEIVTAGEKPRVLFRRVA